MLWVNFWRRFQVTLMHVLIWQYVHTKVISQILLVFHENVKCVPWQNWSRGSLKKITQNWMIHIKDLWSRNGSTKLGNIMGAHSYLYWDVHRCTYSELIDLYIKHVAFMAEHTFMATWNYCQFKQAKEKSRRRWCS